ncbi:MAG TPA: DNA repair protein RadA, partial [Armatimonadetes bacterium]|nr:DNA repair protein RadA [Armatimonadota bacterium]
HAMSMLADGERTTLYITAEESLEQLALRAQRLGAESPQLMVLADTNVFAACEQIEKLQPLVVVVDSIQAMVHPDLSSSPGSVSQIRECTAVLVRVAKEQGIPLFLVGHVTKEGIIAGPKVLEHMVDTVLYMEGDAHYALRIIRATKNRFGPAGEVGVFKMTEGGLECVSEPSEYLLSELNEPVAGNVIAAVVEGKRPLLLEVQALVAPTYFGTPRRVVTGADYNRVSVIIAVLERRAHVRLGDKDVYVNVAGGMRVAEPAMDLPIALAIASSRYDRPLPRDIAVFGEVGLGGEVRSVASPEQRFHEMMKLGFKLCVGPKYRDTSWKSRGGGRIKYLAVQNVHEAIKAVLQVNPATFERQMRVEQYSDAGAEALNFES